MTTHYETLGVDATASQADIKSAYRKLAKKYHPDTVSGDEEKLKNISEAYNCIKTPEKRKQYDESLLNPNPGKGFNFHTAPGGMHDIFKEFFGERLDRQYQIVITLEEAYNGKTFDVNHNGVDYPVNIPGGIADGMNIRVPGLGAVSGDGKRTGDLIVYVRVQPHSTFQRNGVDLAVVVDVNYIDCLLGTDITVKTLNGSMIKVKVPECTNHNTKLKVKNHGMKYKTHNILKSGDLYVIVNSVTPKTLSSKQREILHKLKKEENE